MTNYLRLNISMYNEYRHYLLIIETYLTIEIFLEAHLSITKKLCARSSKENLKIPHTGRLPLEYGRHLFKKGFIDIIFEKLTPKIGDWICTLCLWGWEFYPKPVFFHNIFSGDLHFNALIIRLC